MILILLNFYILSISKDGSMLVQAGSFRIPFSLLETVVSCIIVDFLDLGNTFLRHGWFGSNGFYIPKARGFLHPKGPKNSHFGPARCKNPPA